MCKPQGSDLWRRCRYPNNFVLRLLTPQDTCRPLDIYPVKLTQDAIYIDVGAAASSRAYQSTRGGADSSAERNNVYALQPRSYIQGQDPSGTTLAALKPFYFDRGMD